MRFCLFLHFYQPSIQYQPVLDRIVHQSYIPILEFLERHPQAIITANFCASLSEQLLTRGYKDLLDRFSRLALSGQLELVGSAAYHPLLSKLPEDEIRRQILLNDKINRFCFGGAWKPIPNQGFFPPELAYSKIVGKVLDRLGFKWVLLSESSYPSLDIPDERLYKIKDISLFGFFRDNELSLRTAFGCIRTRHSFRRALEEHLGKREYIIAAMDAETFGHHLKDGLEILSGIFKNDEEIRFCTISQLFPLFDNKIEKVDAQEGTWGTTAENKLQGQLYPRWDLPNNPLHQKEWELHSLAIKLVNSSRCRFDDFDSAFYRYQAGTILPPKQLNWLVARELLDKSLCSDLFWWSSRNPYWHPLLVQENLQLLRRVVAQVPDASAADRRRCSQLINQITKLGLRLYGSKVIGG